MKATQAADGLIVTLPAKRVNTLGPVLKIEGLR